MQAFFSHEPILPICHTPFPHIPPPLLLSHAAASLFLYTHSLQPFQQYHACFFICWQLSTPLLNFRQQAIACGKTHNRAFALANVGFALTFLVVRWGFGIPGTSLTLVLCSQRVTRPMSPMHHTPCLLLSHHGSSSRSSFAHT
jgi:hypothetical protein